MEPILEGLVTTRDPDGRMHLAPMGPRVVADWKQLLFRPFPTSATFRNLKAQGQGVLHVTDDVFLLARTALGDAPAPPHRRAKRVDGFVLSDACRLYEFKVSSIDESGERVHIKADVVHSETLRDFWGFNRAKHAVLEAAILATRFQILPLDEIALEFKKLRTIVEKTGSSVEAEAFAYLQSRLDEYRLGGSHDAR